MEIDKSANTRPYPAARSTAAAAADTERGSAGTPATAAVAATPPPAAAAPSASLSPPCSETAARHVHRRSINLVLLKASVASNLRSQNKNNPKFNSVMTGL